MKGKKFEKTLSKVSLLGERILLFDYVLRILHFSATCFLVNFFEGQAHLQFAMVES